ncbi:MAG: hypothetical protein U1A78_41610 [Polyangia bacterium]
MAESTLSFLDDIGSSAPKARGKILPVLVTSGVNALGGLIAGRVDELASSQFPKTPSAGTFGVFVVSCALRYFFASAKTVDSIARELAAGMAGWVGDDLWYLVKGWLGWGVQTFKAGVTYRAGDKVRYNGVVWQASKDIPFAPPQAPQAEPGRDSRWVRAQGYKLEEMRQMAQAFLAEPELVDALATEAAAKLGPEMEHNFGQEMNPEMRAGFRDSMRRVLQDVVSENFSPSW